MIMMGVLKLYITTYYKNYKKNIERYITPPGARR